MLFDVKKNAQRANLKTAKFEKMNFGKKNVEMIGAICGHQQGTNRTRIRRLQSAANPPPPLATDSSVLCSPATFGPTI
jgi:hypothetical protein